MHMYRYTLAQPPSLTRKRPQIIQSQRVVEAPSPITLAKSLKNPQELEGMRQARDFTFISIFLSIYV